MMNKNIKEPGKKLSRGEMKQLQGGVSAGIICSTTADCPNPCVGNVEQGYYCSFSKRCTYGYCA